MKKIIEYQRNSPFCHLKKELTPHDIVSRIMRKDNYFIALVESGIIDISFFTKRFFNVYFEWVIRQGILDVLYDS